MDTPDQHVTSLEVHLVDTVVDAVRTDVKRLRVPLTPWQKRLLDVAAAVKGRSAEDELRAQWEIMNDIDSDVVEAGVEGGHELLPFAFQELGEIGKGTDTEIGCAAHAHLFADEFGDSHPWDSSDDQDVPTTPKEAREQMAELLAIEPDPRLDPLWMITVDHALALDWAALRQDREKLGALMGGFCCALCGERSPTVDDTEQCDTCRRGETKP